MRRRKKPLSEKQKAELARRAELHRVRKEKEAAERLTQEQELAAKLELISLQEAKIKERCEKSLKHFIAAHWHILEPETPLVWGWPLDAICEHLEAVTRGEIKRLIINVPPGFMKSLCVDVFWPAWEWGPKRMPTMRYICAAYAQNLTERDNGKFRRIITHPDYTKKWSDVFEPSREQFNIIKVENSKTGWKFATSVTGVGTGERGDRFIIDDANSVAESESELVLNRTNAWAREVVPDRLNNMMESVIINIQQRTSDIDVSGTLISLDLGYDHLMIPMEYDSGRRITTSIGWEDPRTKDGTLAWPKRFPRQVVENMKKAKGPYAYAGQYQQSPTPRGGGIIKRDDWQLWPPGGEIAGQKLQFPELEFVVASLDCAYTEKQENDYSALTVWGVFRSEHDLPKLILMTAWKDRLTLNDLVNRVGQTCTRLRVDKLLIEAKASGISVAQEIKRLFGYSKFQVQLIDPKGDKVARTYAVQHIWSEKMVYAPDREWAEMVISEMENFPKASHDDCHDTAVQAVKYLRDIGFALRRDERDQDIADVYVSHKPLTPLYDV